MNLILLLVTICIVFQIHGMDKNKINFEKPAFCYEITHKNNHKIHFDNGNSDLGIYQKKIFKEQALDGFNKVTYKGKDLYFSSHTADCEIGFYGNNVLYPINTKIFLGNIKQKNDFREMDENEPSFDFNPKNQNVAITNLCMNEKNAIISTNEGHDHDDLTLLDISTETLKPIVATQFMYTKYLDLGKNVFACIDSEGKNSYVITIKDLKELRYRAVKIPADEGKFIQKIKLNDDSKLITLNTKPFSSSHHTIDSVKIININDKTITHNLTLPENYDLNGYYFSLMKSREHIGLLIHPGPKDDQITKKLLWNNPKYTDSLIKSMRDTMHEDTHKDKNKLTDIYKIN